MQLEAGHKGGRLQLCMGVHLYMESLMLEIVGTALLRNNLFHISVCYVISVHIIMQNMTF